MATNSAPPGNGPPLKPWERAGAASGPPPFKSPSNGSTSDVVESSGTAKPGEVVPTVNRTTVATTNNLSRPPPRPWEQNYGSTYGGYGSSSMYGGYNGGYNSGYGGNLYGNNMYNSAYGGGLYGGSGMYGGGSMYSSGFGRPMGYGSMGMGMGPYGNPDDPNNPFGPPSQPPGFWISFIRVMTGVVNFFGRVSFLVEQNTHAFHMFMTALLQLFDRSGMLYGELARFIFRLFGIRTKPRKNVDGGGPPSIQGPKVNDNGNSWDNVWGDDLAKGQ